ncbi:hypothetical protein N2152v2_009065 [Parachlorella kessleri]
MARQQAKRYVCKECRKPCRSDTERDVHTRRTGHAEFDDKTNEAQAIDTEQQMKQAQAELMDVDKPEGATEVEPAEMVAAEVDAGLQKQLEEMGFPPNRAVRALHFSGNSSVEGAINWLAEHESDTNLDEPLLVPKEAPKKKLSPEEAKAAAAELVRRAREKREAEERELEKLRERERIRAGKELALAAKQEEDLRLKRIAEERRREKEEEERAREKIRLKLESDRRERRRKLGLPEELTEEEREAERQKAAAKAAEEAKRKLPVKPITAGERMRDRLVAVKKGHPGEDERVKTCFQTLMKFCANVATNPGEEKFRKIRLTNPAVQQRVGSMQGAVEFLELCGFQRDSSGEWLELPADKVDRALLDVAGEQLNSALNNPFFGRL